MFPEFGSASESLTKASSLIFRLGSDAHLYDDPENCDITALLDSKYDSEKCDALKRLLALIAQGFDVSNFFPQVVKSVASQSLELKKLVYLYLLHYSDKRSNEALLSINCFQKDSGHPNPLVRARALRAMAGIRLDAVSPLVLDAVRKSTRDQSPYVRKCAANALPKLHDPRHGEKASAAIEEMLEFLLHDNSPGVVGTAAASFISICPDSLHLIGKPYRRLCEILPDVEEWGQILLTDVLLRYIIARHGPSTESATFSDAIFRSFSDGCWDRSTAGKDGDVQLLLRCTSPLLWSRNGAVVLAAAAVHWIMSPSCSVEKVVGPLVFLLRSSKHLAYMVLRNIHMFVEAAPSLFSPHYKDFFVSSMDPHPVKLTKLQILSAIATDASMLPIYLEFQDYTRDPDRKFAAAAVAAIGRCATCLPNSAQTLAKGLLDVMKDAIRHQVDDDEEEARVLVQAISSLKTIVGLDPPECEKIVVRMVRSLDSIRAREGRRIIVWMVGEYHSLGKEIPRMVRPVMKYLARFFTSEPAPTRLQVLNTLVKISSGSTADGLSRYLIKAAKHDPDYDVRDRAHFMERLATSAANRVFAFFPTDDTMKAADPGKRSYLPGSLSLMVLHAAPGYAPLPQPCSIPANSSQGGSTTTSTTDDDEEDDDDDDDEGDDDILFKDIVRMVGVVKPKVHRMLDPADAGGMRVEYAFCSSPAAAADTPRPGLVSLDVTLSNCSSQTVRDIALLSGEGVTVSMEEVTVLEPGLSALRTVEACFNHHLLPLRLRLSCSLGLFPVKLHPDIGYFVRPLHLDVDMFALMESRLCGMFQYVRCFTFVAHAGGDDGHRDGDSDMCRCLTRMVLGNANVAPVSASVEEGGLVCLRFACETLQSGVACLVTLTCVDGGHREPLGVTVKMNSEETVFALNLLNRIISFLSQTL